MVPLGSERSLVQFTEAANLPLLNEVLLVSARRTSIRTYDFYDLL